MVVNEAATENNAPKMGMQKILRPRCRNWCEELTSDCERISTKITALEEGICFLWIGRAPVEEVFRGHQVVVTWQTGICFKGDHLDSKPTSEHWTFSASNRGTMTRTELCCTIVVTSFRCSSVVFRDLVRDQMDWLPVTSSMVPLPTTCGTQFRLFVPWISRLRLFSDCLTSDVAALEFVVKIIASQHFSMMLVTLVCDFTAIPKVDSFPLIHMPQGLLQSERSY